MADIEAISKTVHAAMRAWARAHGQTDIPIWTRAPAWMRESTRESVSHALGHPDALPSLQHDQWLEQKTRDGWVYGEIKDADAKTHPLMIPYDELPEWQRKKDALVQAIVAALS